MMPDPKPAADDPRRCTAKSKRSGERCRRWAIVGHTVCAMHGGRIPKVMAKAKQNLAQAEATKALAKLELEPTTDPVGRLQLLASEGGALLDYARRKFLESEDIAWLNLYGRSVESLQRQLVDLAKLLPAQPSQPGGPTDSILDRQIEALAGKLVADAGRASLSACPICGEACSVCASEPMPAPQPALPLGLPAPIEDAVVVETPAPPRRRSARPTGPSEPTVSAVGWANQALRRDGW